MSNAGFTMDPSAFGLPSRAQFAAYRVWDSYYFPRTSATPGALLDDIAADLRELEPFGFERFCAYLHVGLGTLNAKGPSSACIS
jgi:hypothetical protein